MKSKSFVLCLVIITILFASNVSFALPFETRAKQAILIDTSTNTILLEKNADEIMPTSSMSKVMTLYVVFNALKQGYIKLEDSFNVSEKAWKMEGSRMFLEVGSKVMVKDLIQGVAVQSGNDATVVLAEGLMGDEKTFVDRMNLAAEELGMNDSHFMNASGWPDPRHYSTARDLAKLAQHIIKDFPEYYKLFSERSFTYNKIYQPNRLPILDKVEGADGIKTGHTEVAGYGLIGSAERDGRRLILVVNGLETDKDREKEATRLLEWGFRNFKNQQILKEGQEVSTAKVWLGYKDEVSLVSDKDVIFSMPAFKDKDIKMKISYNEPIMAPINKGDKLAKLEISIPDQPASSVDLVAGEDIKIKGFFGRAITRFKYFLNRTY